MLRALAFYRWAVFWALCALVFAMPASARTRMWLDRDRIALDETVTLNMEVDASAVIAMPDLAELSRNFRIVDQDVQQQVTWVNGALTALVTIQMTLSPLREGELEIRSLWTGKDAVAPLRLTVLPPRDPRNVVAPSLEIVAPGVPVFIETWIDSEAPYVQQSAGYTLRLYYPLNSQIEGRLDQDPPEGATLQRVGDEQRVTTRVGGIDYAGIERRYLLIPERSGAVTVPPAVFRGRALGLFDSVLDTNRKEITVASKPILLQVKAIPDTAPQPWLPARALRLRYLETPQSLRVGKSATVTVELVADGATAAQLPALMLRTGNDDAQVFSEPPQVDDRFQQDRPRATIVRRFSILPTRDGTLRIVAPRIVWWDTQAGVARIASLPDLTLRVAPGAVGTAAPQDTVDTGSATRDDARGWRAWIPDRGWHWAGLGLGLLWLCALFLGWRLWVMRARPVATSAQVSPGNDPGRLMQALARGDLGAIVQALCATALPSAADLDAVRARLADPAQRAAVDALQRARWGDGDNATTLAALRKAFASGPRWRASAKRAEPVLLPPLYPEL